MPLPELQRISFQNTSSSSRTLMVTGKISLCLAFCLGWINSLLVAQENDAIDRIVLKNGTVLQGRVLEEKKENGRQVLLVKLKSGGMMTLDRAKLVDKVRKYDEIDAKYERALQTAGKAPAAYWTLYEWTEKEVPNGKVRFKAERKFLLEKIVELDPNDKKARYRLGYELKDGQWVVEDAWYISRGYRKVDGRTWESSLESENMNLVQKAELQRKQTKADFDLWKRRAEKRGTDFEAAKADLLKMADEGLAGYLLEELTNQQKEKKANPLRGLYVEVFGQVPCRASVTALSYFAIEEEDPNIRDRALTLLLQPGFDRELAANTMSGHLFKDSIPYLERAAHAIGELNSQGQINSLIGVLQTRRKYVDNPGAQNQPPGSMGMNNTMSSDGSMGMTIPAGPTVKNKIHNSDGALAALKKMTKIDYGFDQAAWRRWYIENYSLHDAEIRTDD